MYYDEDPPRGLATPVTLPNVKEAWHPYRSLLLVQKTPLELPQAEDSARILELRNQEVELPYGDDSQFWCKMFKLDKLERRHHIIKVISVKEIKPLAFFVIIIFFFCLVRTDFRFILELSLFATNNIVRMSRQ